MGEKIIAHYILMKDILLDSILCSRKTNELATCLRTVTYRQAEGG
ncbi:MAG: hypothetical protein ACYSTS_11025 [Planctomycetota bacterium]|jgi:hypothetical protein